MRFLEGAKPDPGPRALGVGQTGRGSDFLSRVLPMGATVLLGVEIGAERTVRQRPRALPGSAVEAPNLSPCRAWRATRPLGACGVQERVLDPRGGEPSCREDELALAVDVVVLALTPVGAGAVSTPGTVGAGEPTAMTPWRRRAGRARGWRRRNCRPEEAEQAPDEAGSSFFVGRDLLRRIATAGACGLCSRKPCSGRPHDRGPGAGLDLGQPKPGPLGPAGRGHFWSRS